MLPRRGILARGLGFSIFYGLIVVNWLDLYPKDIPGYSVLLGILFLAPVVLLLMFTNWRKTWPLALGLTVVISLCNDLGYYFIGDLLFGLQHPLWHWFIGQLGFRGWDHVTGIHAPFGLHWKIASWEMGLSVYLRIALAILVLRFWWRNCTVEGRLKGSTEGFKSESTGKFMCSRTQRVLDADNQRVADQASGDDPDGSYSRAAHLLHRVTYGDRLRYALGALVRSFYTVLGLLGFVGFSLWASIGYPVITPVLILVQLLLVLVLILQIKDEIESNQPIVIPVGAYGA